MGLDGVEFVMAVEDAFQIAISDETASRLQTPRQVVDHLLARLSFDGERACLEQRAFYRLRRAAMRVFETERHAVTPDTPWEAILPRRQRRQNWHLLEKAASVAPWPRLPLWGGSQPEVATVGATARYVAECSPASLLEEGEGLTQLEVETTVTRLMRECLNIEVFGWDQEFVKDLGVG